MGQISTSALFLLALACANVYAQRVTIPLDGEWQIEDGATAGDIPVAWRHTVQVPGLANLARPAFPDVDQFDSREVIHNRIRKKVLPESARVANAGVARQSRNYFWYRKVFRGPERRQSALLKVNKAQFGTAVWLNGKQVGEHLGCFTAGIFNVTEAIAWGAENQLVVRIGAHPGALPEQGYGGTDFEKNRWTPGIYDRVSLVVSDNPVIESVQVAPKIAGPEIVVQTKVRNYGSVAARCRLSQRVRETGAAAKVDMFTLAPGEEQTRTTTIRMPGAKLWSPETPALYTLETATGGDSAATRFGMREFRFDTATKRAYLNGKPYSCADRTSPCIVSSRTPRPAPWHGMRRGCASSWWTSRNGCTGTASVSASGLCRIGGSKSQTKPGY
jgi:beta-galactosidase/beta-glucuronidase